jgi:Flp pilus assembly protein TadD
VSESDLAAEWGFALLDLGRPEQAKDYFEDGLATDPDNPSLLAGLAKALADLGDSEWAIQAADAAVAASPDWHFVHEIRAIVHANVGSKKEAIASADRVVALAPEYSYGHVLVGHLALDRRRKRQAKAAADRALALDPASVPAHRLRAMVALAEGQSEAAEELCRAALRIAPEDHESLLLLGRIQGLTPEAIDSYISAGRLRPADPRARIAVEKLAAGITGFGGLMAGGVLVFAIEATVWVMPFVLRLAIMAAGAVVAITLLRRPLVAVMIRRRQHAPFDPRPRRYNMVLGLRVPDPWRGSPRLKRGRWILGALFVLSTMVFGGSIVQLAGPEPATPDGSTASAIVTLIVSAVLLVVLAVLLLRRERAEEAT